jgi:hypothetical protein
LANTETKGAIKEDNLMKGKRSDLGILAFASKSMSLLELYKQTSS